MMYYYIGCGKKRAAIKEYRIAMNIGIKEAKEYVEVLIVALAIKQSEYC